MASSLTSFDAYMKEYYIDSGRVEKLVYPDNVLMGLLEKRPDVDLVGDNMPVPIQSGNPQGAAGVFTTAQTNNSNVVARKWNITPGDYYGVVRIGDKVLKASRNNMGAFFDNQTLETDGLYETLGENMNMYLWGNGGQAIGQRASIATNDVTLVDDSQAANFEPGMKIVASTADGSGSADALRGGTAANLDGNNRATGVLTSTTWGNITTFSDQDFLFREGDFAGATSTQIVKGVQAFVPATDTLLDLWGVTQAQRQADVQRFGGCRVGASFYQGRSYEERIRNLISQMTGRFKAALRNPAAFLHPEEFEILSTNLAAKGIRPADESETGFGYSKITVSTGSGNIPIYCDRHCPKGSVFVLSLSNWFLASIGKMFDVQNGDGLQMLRLATATDYEIRVISYPALACTAPKNNGRVSLL